MNKTKVTRRQARLKYKRSSTVFKMGTVAAAPFLVAALAYAAIAEDLPKSKGDYSEPTNGQYGIYSLYNGNTPLTFDYSFSAITNSPIAGADAENYQSVEENLEKSTALANTEATECASESGLGGVQMKKMQDEQQMAMATVDLDKLFNLSNNGCFSALSNFPDLSVALPSLGSIFSAIQKTLADYATRKVCTVVNDALEESLGPISKQLDKINESGQLDLTGRVNKALTKKFYEIDPELGRTKPNIDSQKEVEFKW